MKKIVVKLYLLPNIHKRLSDVPSRSAVSNCGTPTEKVSEFLDFHLKPIMRNGNSCIRDSVIFWKKLKAFGQYQTMLC